MKRLLFAICVCCLPQLGHAAGNVITPYSPPQKPSYRYGHAPTPDSYNRSCWCGSPEVGVEALLWRNSTSDFGYVKSSIDGIGTLIRDQPNYDWGVRAYIGYHFPVCWGARISYSYFQDRFSDSRTGDATPPLLSPAYGSGVINDNLSFASATIKDRFQTVDVEVISQLFCGCCATFKAFGGFRWIDLQVRERYDYIPLLLAPFDVIQRSDFTGAGPRFGVYSSLTPIPCSFLNGFEVYGQLAIAAIIGRRSNFFLGSQPFFFTGDNGVNHPRQTLIVPAFDTKLGISYSLPFACFCWTVYVDYEQQLYPKIEERVPATFGLGFPNTAFRAAGFSGINFGLRGKY